MTPALEAGFFHCVEKIGLGADSISIVVHGHEEVLPFDPHPDTFVVHGPFDPELVAAPGGVITALPLSPIVRITLDHQQLTLENADGVRLSWRLCFLGHRVCGCSSSSKRTPIRWAMCASSASPWPALNWPAATPPSPNAEAQR
jgi:hypothetical protein